MTITELKIACEALEKIGGGNRIVSFVSHDGREWAKKYILINQISESMMIKEEQTEMTTCGMIVPLKIEE